VRVRENAEQIALLDGEPAERGRLMTRFGNIMANWHLLMSRQKRLTFFTASYSQISVVFPFIMVSPAYFSGAMQLGGLMQTASAFSSVQGALSFFITVYRQLAEWRAVVERLAGFDQAVATARAAAVTPPVIALAPQGADAIRISDLAVRLPNGAPLVTAKDITLKTNEHVLVTGPSGSGKSTLFRAIAGAWPFGDGKIDVPQNAKVMMLPQRPYFPIASLGSAIIYPAEPGSFSHEQIVEAIAAVGLPKLLERIDEEAHWNRMLSLGEQQRLGIARALLHKPDFLFLDEATASLDEPSEAALYKLLKERLANCTIVSIGHRSTLAAFHQRRLTLAPEAGAHRVQDAALETR
jgi:putative ATP-binding cassette transporter